MKSLLPSCLLSVTLIVSTTIVHAGDPPPIDGNWTIESFALEGKPVEDVHLERLKKHPLIVNEKKMILGDGGTWIRIPGGMTTSKGAIISFDDSKNPAVVRCEMLGLDGWHGIFKIEENKLTICRCSQDNPVPTDFVSTAANKWQVRTYVRSKPTK